MLEINWIMLIGAAVVLLVPATFIYPAAGKDRLVHSHSGRFRVEEMLGTWQHWLDLVRAFGGTFVLTRVSVSFVPLNDEVGGYMYQDLAVIGAVLLVAVVLQTVHFRKFFYFTAPVFFLWGMTFALYEWIPAVFAVLFAAVIGRMANSVELKLPIMAGLLAIVGYLVHGFSLTLVMNSVLIGLPVVVALCAMQHLVCYSRVMGES